MRKNKECKHTKSHFVRWPDGGDVEVCKECGLSRHHSGWHTSDWLKVDIEKAYKEMLKNMNKIIKKMERG